MEKKMPEIEECLIRLLEELHPMKRTVTVALTEGEGKILAEDVYAEINVPPFPKSAMDGYALRAEDITGASREHPVKLRVAGELLAGDYAEIPWEKNTAVRVMTGSYIPKGFDAVLRQEDTDYGEETVSIYASVKSGTNYCAVGEDIRRGEKVLEKGVRLSPLHMGLLASLGRAKACVYAPAKIAVLSTGTELTEAGVPLLPGRIYNSIGYILAADIRREGFTVMGPDTCADEEGLLQQKIETALQEADMVITTGAVSAGKKDILPAVLDKMGAKVLFQYANIQPGTPTMAASRNGKVILCLSGNPYAAIANFELYFWPAVAKLMHNDSFLVKTGEAVLDSAYPKVNRLRRMVRAYAAEGRVRLPASVHASSVIGNLTECNCFIDLEPGREVKPGDKVRIRYFRSSPQ